MKILAEVISLLFTLYIYMVLLRFVLQWARADFYNPLSQFVVKLTNPLLLPLRKMVPGIGGQDMAALVLAYLLSLLLITLKFLMLMGCPPQILPTMGFGLFFLLNQFIDLFIFLLIVLAIGSFFITGYHPVYAVIVQATDPLLRPVRRMMPAISGIDLSPMVLLIGLWVLSMLLAELNVFLPRCM